MISTPADHTECEFPSWAPTGCPRWHLILNWRPANKEVAKVGMSRKQEILPRSWLRFFKNRGVEAWHCVPGSAHYLFKSFQLHGWVVHADRWGNWDRGDPSKSTQLVGSKARTRLSCAYCPVLLRKWLTPSLHLLSLLLYWNSQDPWEPEPSIAQASPGLPSAGLWATRTTCLNKCWELPPIRNLEY